MGDATVRAAVKSYFSGNAVTGIAKWFRDEPWIIQPATFALAANGGWGAVGFIHLDTAEENRETFGGANGVTPTGSKAVKHTVSLVIQYQYLIPPALPAGVDEDAWVGPLDNIIDAVKALIRADPTLGTSALQPNPTINWAGQSWQGAPDIRQTRDLPTRDPQGSKILSWNRIEFDLIEYISG
jgi:hypothetical protein